MIFALWEVLIPLLVAFLLGVLLGWFIWRWRRTEVTGAEWRRLEERASAGDRAAQSTQAADPADAANQIAALKADVEIREIEIAQLRKARSDATVAATVATTPDAPRDSDDTPATGSRDGQF